MVRSEWTVFVSMLIGGAIAGTGAVLILILMSVGNVVVGQLVSGGATLSGLTVGGAIGLRRMVPRG